MTSKQASVLAFIRKFQRENRYSPTFRDISSFVGSPYKSAGQKHVNNLVRLGYLEKTPIGTLRMWRPLTLPVYSMPLWSMNNTTEAVNRLKDWVTSPRPAPLYLTQADSNMTMEAITKKYLNMENALTLIKSVAENEGLSAIQSYCEDSLSFDPLS